jgi:hypothetical protein
LNGLHQFSHAVHVELAHRILAMLAHRERTDAQSSGDFLAGQSIADKPGDLYLARSQVGTRPGKSAEEPSAWGCMRSAVIPCAVN